MHDGRPELPDPATALSSAATWAKGDAKLAALLRLGLGPGDAVGRWGVDSLRTNRVADAAVAFRTALALLPEAPVLWTHFGLALDRGGSLGEAAACFARSLELDGRQIDTWLLLGLAKKRQGDRSGAGDAYRTALALEPHSAVVWQCLGLLEEEQRDYPAAIECFEACLRHGSPSAAVSANLGKLYYQVGRILDAHAAYATAAESEPGNEHYAQMHRKAQFLRDVLRGDAVADALDAYASPAASTATPPAGREHDALLEAACAHLGSFGEIDAAIRVARTRVDFSPDSVTANYLLRALLNEPGVDCSPREYIVESFDAFADGFDAKLVGVLGYDVPDKLAALIRDRTDRPAAFLDALDAGCGTGLCGPPLRPLARSLTGVDLSPRDARLGARARGLRRPRLRRLAGIS